MKQELDQEMTGSTPHQPAAMSTTRRTLMKTAAAGAMGSVLMSDIATAAQDPPIQPDGSQGKKPNIVVIMGDDIGYWNLSAYNMGMMGYHTPNIDRIAQEGMIFTDAYGEQSCTAGRAAFISGQHPVRTGLLRIGFPGQDIGLHEDDPTLAEVLKPEGYKSGQFGKNHLGDMNKYLPTVRGFDEFLGNLYHLNAEEEPEHEDYPDNPLFAAQFGPRGVIHSFASDEDDDTEDRRYGRVGKQVIEEQGPLTTEWMETIDEDLLDGAIDFIDRAHAEDDPFFVWFCPTRMHIWTHLKEESEGVTGLGVQADGLVEHDGHVGQLLDHLDELGITDNTIVVYTTDNGAQIFTWPDGNMTPFRGEKNSNWEGAYRVPMMVRWPEQITAGTVSNDIISLQDWMPTLASAAGIPSINEQLLDGYQVGDKTFTAYIDGFDQMGMLTEGKSSARSIFYYFNELSDMVAVRANRWKFIQQEQQSVGIDIWLQPFDELRGAKLVDLRGDPFERAMVEAPGYDIWMLERLYLIQGAQVAVQQLMQTFEAFPPRVPNTN